MATIAIIGALEKEIMQIKEELSNVCMVQEAGLNVAKHVETQEEQINS